MAILDRRIDNLDSFAGGLLSVWFLHQNRPFAFAAANLLSYVFDCMDGQFARAYAMTSSFGDVYDHTTDIIVWVLVGVVIFRQKRHLLGFATLGAGIVACLGLTLHMGCQQRLRVMPATAGSTPPERETLDVLRFACRSDDWIQWARFFGPGTFNLVTVCAIVFLYTRRIDETNNVD